MPLSRDVPGYANVLGSAASSATVTVNNQATYRKGDYFRKELTEDNSSSALYPTLTTIGVKQDGSNPDIVTTVTGHVFVPRTPESFGYDDDGNLTSDGRWNYTWDAENRLVKMQSLAGSPTPERRIEFAYDWQGRRVRKTVWDDRDNGEGTELLDTVNVYDGWNLLAELDANASNAKVRTYLWGLDLSGSEQGAGGVGGLLAVTVHSGSQAGTYFYGYDGNGNVMALVKSADGKVYGRYEFGPFGELVRANGLMAKINPFRFSTKYQDDESDLLYYGYRSYNPSSGRWLNRDPIEERGGENLYGFVQNCPQSLIDPLGRDKNVPPGGNPFNPWPYFCDPCASGPVFGTATKTLRDWRWHVWGRTWQPWRIRLYVPNTGILITTINPPWPVSEKGYWVISGGWVVVDATCKVPQNASILGWTLTDFNVTDWPSIGPNMKPSVMCKYTCGKETVQLPGEGAMSGPPPLQREDNTDKNNPPPPIFR